MYLQDIVLRNPEHCFLLYFQNLSPVSITADDMKPESTFFRRSKKRLGEPSFDVVANGTVDPSCDAASEVTVYSSRRGHGSDWVLYESGSAMYIQTWVNTHAKGKAHSYYQRTLSSITEPENDHILDAFINNTDQGIIIEFKGTVLTDGSYKTRPMLNLYECQWYLTATVYAIKLAQDSPAKHLVIHYPDKYSRDVVFNLSSHRWKPYRNNIRFVSTMDKLREEINLNVSFKARK